MGNALGETPLFPLRGGYANQVDTTIKAVIGAAGAVASSTVPGDPAWTIVNNGTGQYDITFPVCSDVAIDPAVVSPLPTVSGAIVTAYSATGGTATIKTLGGNLTPTNPASGDELHIGFSLKAWAS